MDIAMSNAHLRGFLGEETQDGALEKLRRHFVLLH